VAALAGGECAGRGVNSARQRVSDAGRHGDGGGQRSNMAAAMAIDRESPGVYPESPNDQDDVVYPCKGCGEVL
jgi:hypothetical protein